MTSPVGIRWAAVAAAVALVAWGALTPRPALPELDVPFADKLLHAGAFGVVAVLVGWALVLPTRRGLARWLGAWTFAVGYGIAVEVLQGFVPGRSQEVADAVADAVGATIGLALLGALVRWRTRASRVDTPGR